MLTQCYHTLEKRRQPWIGTFDTSEEYAVYSALRKLLLLTKARDRTQYALVGSRNCASVGFALTAPGDIRMLALKEPVDSFHPLERFYRHYQREEYGSAIVP